MHCSIPCFRGMRLSMQNQCRIFLFKYQTIIRNVNTSYRFLRLFRTVFIFVNSNNLCHTFGLQNSISFLISNSNPSPAAIFLVQGTRFFLCPEDERTGKIWEDQLLNGDFPVLSEERQAKGVEQKISLFSAIERCTKVIFHVHVQVTEVKRLYQGVDYVILVVSEWLN